MAISSWRRTDRALGIALVTNAMLYYRWSRGIFIRLILIDLLCSNNLYNSTSWQIIRPWYIDFCLKQPAIFRIFSKVLHSFLLKYVPRMQQYTISLKLQLHLNYNFLNYYTLYISMTLLLTQITMTKYSIILW